MKTECWNGYHIRFVENDGEWWAVLSDVSKALGLRTDKVISRMESGNLSKVPIRDSIGRMQATTIVNELGIYEAVFESRKKEAKEFKRWVYGMLKQLRQSSGLEGFEIFRMLDKDHQKEMMRKLNAALRNPVRTDFIKANTIANKAVSLKYGYPKMIKKGDMTPDMLVDREVLLEDTVALMEVNERYHLDISVSRKIYDEAQERNRTA